MIAVIHPRALRALGLIVIQIRQALLPADEAPVAIITGASPIALCNLRFQDGSEGGTSIREQGRRRRVGPVSSTVVRSVDHRGVVRRQPEYRVAADP